VISEFPFGTPPLAENFPRRNRVVSGMSRGVLVVEADARSGALITARLANEEQGRPVFALPGRVDSSTSVGPHRLIRDGAVLTCCLEDILEELPSLSDSIPDPPASSDTPLFAAAASPAMTDDQRAILDEMDQSPASVDELVERTGLPASTVLQQITFLTLKGLVRRADGQNYRRTRSSH
jgi:DNA processing protein